MAEYPDREYVILESSEINNVNLDEILECFSSSLRYSTDKAYFLVKFEGKTPSFLEGKEKYTHHEIKEIVDDVDGIWYVPPVIDEDE